MVGLQGCIPIPSGVMAGPVPAIYASTDVAKMAGTSPAMTGERNWITAPFAGHDGADVYAR